MPCLKHPAHGDGEGVATAEGSQLKIQGLGILANSFPDRITNSFTTTVIRNISAKTLPNLFNLNMSLIDTIVREAYSFLKSPSGISWASLKPILIWQNSQIIWKQMFSGVDLDKIFKNVFLSLDCKAVSRFTIHLQENGTI